ncbi:MAG: hypothetical protein CM15mV129_210 [uncultured marine virus]|nr:MAG: hypothetical protein CM15mV129_210 [uncultured marine virus]
MHPKHKEFVKYYAKCRRDEKAEWTMDLKVWKWTLERGWIVPIGKKEELMTSS